MLLVMTVGCCEGCVSMHKCNKDVLATDMGLLLACNMYTISFAPRCHMYRQKRKNLCCWLLLPPYRVSRKQTGYCLSTTPTVVPILTYSPTRRESSIEFD